MSHTKYKFNLKYLTLTPTDRAYFNSRGMILKKTVEEHYIMVSATYYSSLHYCSKNIFLISIYKYSYIIWHLSLVNLDPPPGHDLHNLCRGPLYNYTYHLSISYDTYS